LSGLPGLKELRSISQYGISVVTAIFEDHLDLYFVRQLVNERLAVAVEQIPSEYARPMMGPLTTGLGEVYQFTLSGEGYSPMELRTLLEWDIGRRLRSVPGVVEVNIWGGREKQFQVMVDPQKLLAVKLSLKDVYEALERNNALAGGGYIVHEREQFLIRGEAMAKGVTDLGKILVNHAPGGIPIYINDVALVQEGANLRIGAATRMGEGETVIGMVQMLAGANAQHVVEQVKTRVQEIQASLPAGVVIEPYYDRSIFVSQVIQTVRTNLVEGGLLVIAILFVFLGNFRSGLIVAAAIPISMLIAFTGMLKTGISGNLMSLGAIDFGLLVDGSVVMIDNILRKLSSLKDRSVEARVKGIHDAAKEVVRPITFAMGIIILVYLPILTLTGLEGKMFRPMAFTVIFALVGSLIFAVAAVPTLAFWIAKTQPNQKENWLLQKLRNIYEPCLRFSMSKPLLAAGAAIGLFVVSLFVGTSLGVVFMPRLDEGDLAIQVWRLPSVSLDESVATALQVEASLRKFPEVIKVVSRTGSPEVATDPMGIELSDVFAVLKPKDQWVSARTKEELIEKMQQAILESVHGVGLGFTQPIEMRFNELIAGTRSDVSVKIFGQDLSVLRKHAEQVASALQGIPGAADVKAQQVSGVPRIRIIVDRDQIARYGINADDVLTYVQTARAGQHVGTIFEGERRFPLVVRLTDQSSASPAALRNLLVPTPHGELVPLSRIAQVVVDEGPAQISRENNNRRIVVEANIRGRDLGGFMDEAQKQFEHLEEATQRLTVIVPVTLLLIIGMLSLIFGTLRPAFLIFLNVPLALSGGILALWIRGLPLSISATVGFIALFGIAVLNGVVLVSRIRTLEGQGLSLEQAVSQGALDRLRAVLMTALVASLGFLPMALATTMGAEVQRPLATVVIGGLITSTALTLLVIPAVYRYFCPRSHHEPNITPY
jgi:cobalt-zinc-cadmium resistance protein CzcA